MITVFSGWRHWPGPNEPIHRFAELCMQEGDLIRVGDGPSGVDKLVRDQLAEARYGNFELYEAAWNLYGKRAGPIRNRAMLTGYEGKNAGLLLAFPEPGTGPESHSGTWDCIRQARELDIRELVWG